MRETDTHIYFWGSYLSNFHKCDILYNNIRFHCSEQLYMIFKAVYFNDYENATKIMTSNNPKEAKFYGRQVSGFNQSEWNSVSYKFMKKAVEAKFKQNLQLRNKLLNTGSKILVEASPIDLIWGVGLHEDDDKILNDVNWTGENRLGKVIMEVREELR